MSLLSLEKNGRRGGLELHFYAKYGGCSVLQQYPHIIQSMFNGSGGKPNTRLKQELHLQKHE